MYNLDIPFAMVSEAFLADLTISFTNQVLHITEERKGQSQTHNVEWIYNHLVVISTN